MLSYKKSQIFCTTDIFLENQLRFSVGALVEYHVDDKNSSGGIARKNNYRKTLNPKITFP